MKKLSWLISIFMVVALVGCETATAPTAAMEEDGSSELVAAKGGNSHAKATGGVVGRAGSTDINLDFNAHGTDPAKGQVNYSATNGNWFKGAVTCYFQDGNEAAFGGVVNQSNQASWEYFLVEVQDNGQPDETPADAFRVRIVSEAAAQNCTLDGSFPAEVIEGNLKVH